MGMDNKSDLKKQVLRGGISLTIRQLSVAVFSLISVLVTAKILGPESYGIATVSLGFFYFLLWLSRLGIHAHIIRRPDLEEEEIIQIQAFFLTSGLVACILLWLLAPALGWWTKQSEITTAFRYLLPGLWLNMASVSSVSMLERELRFVEVGFVDAFAKMLNSISAILFAFLGWGYLSIIFGAVLGFAIQAALSCWLRPIPFTLKWQWKIISPALRYGATFSFSDFLRSLKNLRVSLLLTRFVSVEAAGIVGISIRLVEQLSMLRFVLLRMSISVMAKIQDDSQKTLRAISKGMAYQALLNGSACAFFSVCSAWIIPLMFDERWLASAAIFPFIAAGLLALSIFDLHTSTLHASGHNRDVIVFNFFYVAILWLISAGLTPSFGIWGYGMSEIFALPVFYILHYYVKKLVGSPNYWNVFWISLATAIPLFGGIFISPIQGTLLFLLSYAIMLVFCKNIRALITELVASKRLA